MGRFSGWLCLPALTAGIVLSGGCSAEKEGTPSNPTAANDAATTKSVAAVTLPSTADRNALAAALSPLVESRAATDAVATAQASGQLTPFEAGLLGTLATSRRLLTLYGKSSLTSSEEVEAKQLVAALSSNTAVTKWLDLVQTEPAKCSDIQRLFSSNVRVPSVDQANALAASATKLLNQCSLTNGTIPGVWAGLFQEDALSSVLLDDEVLPRNNATQTIEAIGGGILLVGGVALAILVPPAAPIGIGVAAIGAGLVGTALGSDDPTCVNCTTDGSTYTCAQGCDVGSQSQPLTAANGCLTGVATCSATVGCPSGSLCAYGCCELGTSGLTATTATTAQYTVTLSFPGGLLPKDIALWSSEGLFINDRVHVLKEDGTGAPVVEVVAGPMSRLGVDTVVGTTMTGGSIAVSDRANIQGNLYAVGGATLQDPKTNVITGTVLQQAAAAQAIGRRTFIGWVTTFQTTGISDVSLEPNTTRQLAPGDYRNLSVKAGATIVLSQGTYHFENISIESGAIVQVHGTLASVINVRSSMSLRGTVQQLDSATSTLSVVYVGTSSFFANQTFRGTLIAPFADINLDIANLSMVASVWGRTITVHQGGFIKLPANNAWNVFTASLQ